MKHRLVEFHSRETFTSDVTKVIDINIKDAITSIIIGLEVLNAGTSLTAHPLACLTKIEIVDGSDVLYNLDAYEAEALDWYNNKGKFRSNWNIALNGSAMSRYIGIHFGRFPFDPLYALDPGRFNNLQIRLTLDIDAGGASTSTNYLTLWANVFDEQSVSPVGFLSAKEIKEYTIASAAHEYTDLPTDLVYRGIYLRPFVAGTEPNQVISNVKISEDQDKRVPINVGAQVLTRTLLEKYPEVIEHYYFETTAAQKYLYVAPSTRVAAVGAVWAEAAAANSLTLYDGDGGRLKVIASGTTNVQIIVRGHIPHCVYQIANWDQDDVGEWFDPRGIGSLIADITGAAAATGYLFAEQLRNY